MLPLWLLMIAAGAVMVFLGLNGVGGLLTTFGAALLVLGLVGVYAARKRGRT